MSDLAPLRKSATELAALALECRRDILVMLEKAQSGHPGGSLSAIDLITTLFFHEMRMNPQDALWADRDRFVLSKGHGVPALYAVLAKRGAIESSVLGTLRKINSQLQGHPDRVLLPFVEASTGSLGQGLSIAQGIALALKLQKKNSRVFCLMGDGETQEGQVWETAMSAPKFKLNNLVAIVDCNNGQIDGHVKDVMDLEPVVEKWKAFRWAVQEIDGHSFPAIISALEKARAEIERPTLIIARTTKGKGVSFMENQIGWHGVAPNPDELQKALGDLGRSGK
ncbi:MAG: transketolase [Proteobacteria bacterium]|nr:transketolase [Pseudomonadota bacterium]NDC23677.1 transketolase [Pseudomonadota bacterium]NDD04169.1 transketolase [Pseudomonadota bacterium]NDG26838.1 transketolase [Pseudomonadota bacterium]